MAPEIVIALVTAASAVGVAVVTALPALMAALRRTRNAVGAVEDSVAAQGAETRAATIDALDAVGSRLQPALTPDLTTCATTLTRCENTSRASVSGRQDMTPST